MKCVVCKIGDLKKGKTTVTLRRAATVLVLEDVDALICNQCGHYYLDQETAEMTMSRLNDAVSRGFSLRNYGNGRCLIFNYSIENGPAERSFGRAVSFLNFGRKQPCGVFLGAKIFSMKHILALGFVFFTSFLNAQNEPFLKILNDPDVVWAAEIRPIFLIEPDLVPLDLPSHFWSEEDSLFCSNLKTLNDCIPLKIWNERNENPTFEGILLSQKLYDLCFHSREKAYAEENGKPVFYDAQARWKQLKTLSGYSIESVAFDPINYSERIVEVAPEPSFGEIKAVRLRQLLFFRQSSGEFEIYTAAFAPLFLAFVRFRTPIFWFSLPPYSKKKNRRLPNLKNRNITWATHMKTRDNSPRFDSLVPLKNCQPPILEKWLARFYSDSKYAAFASDWKPIPMEKRANWQVQNDTTVFYQPAIFNEELGVDEKEKIDLVFTCSEPLDVITDLRLNEDWFWDEKRKKLIVRLRSFAPAAIDVHFGFRRVLFWKKVR